MSQLKSNRALSDKDLIHNDYESASIEIQINLSDDLKINLFRKGPRKVYVNNLLLKKQSNIKNHLRTVCFCSNDINIVSGEPSYRRIWLDRVINQLEPVYNELLTRYNKLLKQRSFLWRSNISKIEYKSLLDSYDSQLALIGTRIFRRRKRALIKLRPKIEYWHNYLSKSKEKIGLNYLSIMQKFSAEKDSEEYIKDKLNKELFLQRDTEALTGKCGIGPHRDDIEFLINDSSVRKFGSSGQQRTITLALKMAELELIRKIISINPILILDDVLAELDLERQNLLLNSVGQESQCFISATHLDKLNNDFLGDSQIINL